MLKHVFGVNLCCQWIDIRFTNAGVQKELSPEKGSTKLFPIKQEKKPTIIRIALFFKYKYKYNIISLINLSSVDIKRILSSGDIKRIISSGDIKRIYFHFPVRRLSSYILQVLIIWQAMLLQKSKIFLLQK